MRKRVPRAEENFQMAPMIDMVFLLLVFFMTVSTLAKEARPETGLPVSHSAAVPSEAPPREIITVLERDDAYQLFWYNIPVGPEELAGLLKAAAERGGEPEVLLRGPATVPWSEWQGILDIVREAGIGDITFATYEN